MNASEALLVDEVTRTIKQTNTTLRGRRISLEAAAEIHKSLMELGMTLRLCIKEPEQKEVSSSLKTLDFFK